MNGIGAERFEVAAVAAMRERTHQEFTQILGALVERAGVQDTLDTVANSDAA